MKSLKKGPSPAMIVAVTAMAFALVGTAVAANDGLIYPKLTKSKVKKIAKKQATKQLKANVSGSHVNEADHATNADNADNASRATDANTIAYGSFEADGTIAGDDRVKNLANVNVTHPAAGTYCFQDLSFTALSAMVSADNGFGFSDTLASLRIATPAGSALGGCPAEATVRVLTFDVSAASLQDRRFLIWFQD